MGFFFKTFKLYSIGIPNCISLILRIYQLLLLIFSSHILRIKTLMLHKLWRCVYAWYYYVSNGFSFFFYVGRGGNMLHSPF
jgi:hypothetical protein